MSDELQKELQKRDDFYRNGRRYGTTRIGVRPRIETPESILQRLALRLNCEPRQVADRVIRMLEERQNGSN